MMPLRPLTVVVSGSFRRHHAGINEAIAEFESLGVEVLSPRPSQVVNPGEPFALLASDDTHDPRTLEQRHLDAIARADALYLFDPEGYVGSSAAMEIGWAMALGKPVFCRERAADVTLALYTDRVAFPAEVKAALLEARERPLQALPPRASVMELQKVSQLLSVQRGFDDEKPLELMLLMVEEVGELAKALRKEVGLKFDAATVASIGKIELEAADVFIYLLHLANVCGFDLEEAFRKKETLNSQREWRKSG